jgi:DNA-nicking Smr family endonuclease
MKRVVDLPDHGLWDEVKRTIRPLGKSKSRPKVVNNGIVVRTSKPVVSTRYVSHDPPPLAGFDRRTAQKLSRGQVEPEARLDLHGEGVETARIKLYHFLQNQQQQGARLVLVITGKGQSPYARHTLHSTQVFHTPEREGRLRREVPLWLHEAQFRSHAIGYQPAHPRHGGGGAFYVRLRRLVQT